jgi:hypothetical protein
MALARDPARARRGAERATDGTQDRAPDGAANHRGSTDDELDARVDRDVPRHDPDDLAEARAGAAAE